MKAIALAIPLVLVCARQADRGGASTIRVKGMTEAEEDRVRLQERRVQRALQVVIVRHDLEGLDVTVVIEKEGGPNVSMMLKATGATVSINERQFLDDPPASDETLKTVGITSLQRCAKMSPIEDAP